MSPYHILHHHRTTSLQVSGCPHTVDGCRAQYPSIASTTATNNRASLTRSLNNSTSIHSRSSYWPPSHIKVSGTTSCLSPPPFFSSSALTPEGSLDSSPSSRKVSTRTTSTGCFPLSPTEIRQALYSLPEPSERWFHHDVGTPPRLSTSQGPNNICAPSRNQGPLRHPVISRCWSQSPWI